MIKNYVVWTNCQVNETQKRFNIEPCADAETRAAYDTMFQISHASAKKFLEGSWESIVFTEAADSRVSMFKDNWQRIWDLWHTEPCNILYLDSDTMFIKPTKIFDRFGEFRLFNWSDPKCTDQYQNYFNAGVRYYPSTMSHDVWSRAAELAGQWNLDIWDQEQLIFNEMFWSQPIPDHDRRHPELNWQGMLMTVPDPKIQAAHESWNELLLKDAHIIHLHGSRGAVKNAGLMSHVSQQLGLEFTY
jgi:hypothetical protein